MTELLGLDCIWSCVFNFIWLYIPGRSDSSMWRMRKQRKIQNMLHSRKIISFSHLSLSPSARFFHTFHFSWVWHLYILNFYSLRQWFSVCLNFNNQIEIFLLLKIITQYVTNILIHIIQRLKPNQTYENETTAMFKFNNLVETW